MYNVTLRRVRATIVAVKSDNYNVRVSVCNFSYPACNAQTTYFNLWPARNGNIFPQYFIKGTIFCLKKVIEYKGCDFIVSANFF